MKNAEFVALLMANTNKTRNLRTYSGKWYSASRRISDKVLCRIGHVIALLQANINQGRILKDRNTESLLVYSFQPILLMPNEESFYVTLDAMIRPMEMINETEKLVGTPLQFSVELISGEVMNTTKAMMDTGLIIGEDLHEDNKPESYGFFRQFNAVTGFVALWSSKEISPEKIFSGKLDGSKIVRRSVGFDSVMETYNHIMEQDAEFGWVAELTLPKEYLPSIIKKGFHQFCLKLISHKTVEVTSNPKAHEMEAKIEDELHALWEAIGEPQPAQEERIQHPLFV